MLKKLTIFLMIYSINSSLFASEDIRWIKDPMIWFMDFIFYQFFILLLLIILYLYYKKFIHKNKKKKIKWPNFKKNLLESLKKLKKHGIKWDKSLFYSELNSAFRKYFEILWIENSDTLTLNDVKKLDLNKSIINLFEKSYLCEFSDKTDTNKIRLELVDKLIKHIK